MKKIAAVSTLIVLVMSVLVYAASADKVKIAVASDGKTASSVVSGVAGRSAYYLIFDSKGKLLEAIENPHKDAAGGAGPLVVNFLAGKGITVVVAGKFGDKMIGAMKGAGMAYVEFTGTADDGVKKYLKLK
jgi:predicted Fe-Mo cluster-binding NifX family protein